MHCIPHIPLFSTTAASPPFQKDRVNALHAKLKTSGREELGSEKQTRKGAKGWRAISLVILWSSFETTGGKLGDGGRKDGWQTHDLYVDEKEMTRASSATGDFLYEGCPIEKS